MALTSNDHKNTPIKDETPAVEDDNQTWIVAKDNDGKDVRMKSEDHADWERRQLEDRK